MADLDRIPVVIGAGQHTNRVDDPDAAPSPFDMVETVARAAAADCGGEAALSRLTHLWVVNSLSIRHGDPAGEVAERLGISPADRRYSGVGGNMPQWLVNRIAESVVAGERPLALIAGVEALATMRRYRARGEKPPWPKTDAAPELWPPLESDMGLHPAEAVDGMPQPTHMYAIVESALRHVEELDLETHRVRMGRLMERLNAVATDNPVSWFPERRSAEELVAVSDENRMICTPYPKYVNAVMSVDMAAAVIITDAATARELGVPADAVASLVGWNDAKEVWHVSSRPHLYESHAVSHVGRAALAQAGCRLDDVAAFDLYSCFPSSIQVAMRGLGLAADDDRPITLTGGLPYHGGPGNNFVTHAIAGVLERVRGGADEKMLVHGNGYYLSKHAVGVYEGGVATEVRPPEEGVQARVDRVEPLPVEGGLTGNGEVVAYTVPHDREGRPEAGLLVAEVEGVRTLAVADDDLTAAFLEQDAVEMPVRLSEPGSGSGPATAHLE